MPSEDDQQEIRVPPRRKYFTILPNIYDNSKLDPYEYRLLGHYCRVGDCWESTRTTAEITEMSLGAVVKKRNSLADKDFISLSVSEYGTIQVTVIDKWHENTARYGGTSKERSPDEQPVHVKESKRSPGDIKEEPIKKEPLEEERTSLEIS